MIPISIKVCKKCVESFPFLLFILFISFIALFLKRNGVRPSLQHMMIDVECLMSLNEMDVKSRRWTIATQLRYFSTEHDGKNGIIISSFSDVTSEMCGICRICCFHVFNGF